MLSHTPTCPPFLPQASSLCSVCSSNVTPRVMCLASCSSSTSCYGPSHVLEPGCASDWRWLRTGWLGCWGAQGKGGVGAHRGGGVLGHTGEGGCWAYRLVGVLGAQGRGVLGHTGEGGCWGAQGRGGAVTRTDDTLPIAGNTAAFLVCAAPPKLGLGCVAEWLPAWIAQPFAGTTQAGVQGKGY